VAFLVAALVVGASALSAEREVVARSSGDTVALPDTPRNELALYGRDAGGERPQGRAECEPASGGPGVTNNTRPDTFEVDGRTLHLVGHVRGGWADGESVTCPGLSEVVAVVGGGPLLRLALAGMLLAGAVIAAVLALLGRGSRRARRDRATAPPARS